MATQSNDHRDCPLLTTSGRCLVAIKDKLLFRRATNVQKWKVYECKKGGAQVCLEFVWHVRSKDHLLIVEGNEVKLKPVLNFKGKEDERLNTIGCQFEWHNVNGETGSLHCVAEGKYLAVGKKRNLIASREKKEAEVFQLI